MTIERGRPEPLIADVDKIGVVRNGPVTIRALTTRIEHDGHGTMFVATSVDAHIAVSDVVFPLPAGCYAALPGTATVHGGRGIAVTHRRHRGLFSVGGPIESTGRLAYIDGCRDTVLVAPVVRGDPCLNLLHVARRVVQADHDHPSLRVGLVMAGHGRCVLDGCRSLALDPGTCFLLPPGATHRFETDEHDLLLVAWHPDSDVGPTDEDHPMINRTLRPGTLERLR